MKPIDTVYRGYRFRSRLEARWAVFLTHLEADWSYEPEGFDLGGTWYLPDFFVKDWDCWIEVKADQPSPEDLRKCLRLSQTSKRLVLLIVGQPWSDKDHDEYHVVTFDPREGREGDNNVHGWVFGEGRRCAQEIWLVNDAIPAAFTIKKVAHDDHGDLPLTAIYALRIAEALAAARQARFEHGAVPANG